MGSEEWYKAKKKFANSVIMIHMYKNDIIILLKEPVAVKALLLARISLLTQPKNKEKYRNIKLLNI